MRQMARFCFLQFILKRCNKCLFFGYISWLIKSSFSPDFARKEVLWNLKTVKKMEKLL